MHLVDVFDISSLQQGVNWTEISTVTVNENMKYSNNEYLPKYRMKVLCSFPELNSKLGMESYYSTYLSPWARTTARVAAW